MHVRERVLGDMRYHTPPRRHYGYGARYSDALSPRYTQPQNVSSVAAKCHEDRRRHDAAAAVPINVAGAVTRVRRCSQGVAARSAATPRRAARVTRVKEARCCAYRRMADVAAAEPLISASHAVLSPARARARCWREMPR